MHTIVMREPCLPLLRWLRALPGRSRCWVNPPPPGPKASSQRHFPSALGKSWLARKFPPVFSGSLGSILWFVTESLGRPPLGGCLCLGLTDLRPTNCSVGSSKLLFCELGTDTSPGFHGTSCCLGEMLSGLTTTRRMKLTGHLSPVRRPGAK